MGVRHMTERGIALDTLYQVKMGAVVETVGQEVQRREKMECDEEECKRALWTRNTYPANSLRAWVLKLNGKDREVIVSAEPLDHPAVAATDRIVRYNAIVHDRDLWHGTPMRSHRR